MPRRPYFPPPPSDTHPSRPTPTAAFRRGELKSPSLLRVLFPFLSGHGRRRPTRHKAPSDTARSAVRLAAQHRLARTFGPQMARTHWARILSAQSCERRSLASAGRRCTLELPAMAKCYLQSDPCWSKCAMRCQEEGAHVHIAI